MKGKSFFRSAACHAMEHQESARDLMRAMSTSILPTLMIGSQISPALIIISGE